MPLDGSELTTLAADLKKAADHVKTTAEKHAVEIKNLGDATAETKAAADKAILEMNTLAARVGECELQLSRRGDDAGGSNQKSVGEEVITSEQFKSFAESGGRGTARVHIKAVTSVSSSAGPLIQPDVRRDVIPLPRVRLTIRDLLSKSQTTSNSIEYVRQLAVTNNAAVVAETATKPESNYTWEPATTPVRTLAHWTHVSRQALDDAPMLRGLIEDEMAYGLALAEEREILGGDGTGQHLLGLIPEATAYSAAFTVASATRLDAIRLGILQATLAGYPADGVVLNPTDWAGIETTKTSDGSYLFANPQGVAGPTLWGIPVIASTEIAVDKFLVGAFRAAATIYDRMGTEILISSEDRSNFITNMLTLRCEKRLALAVRLPSALIYGDFGLVS